MDHSNSCNTCRSRDIRGTSPVMRRRKRNPLIAGLGALIVIIGLQAAAGVKAHDDGQCGELQDIARMAYDMKVLDVPRHEAMRQLNPGMERHASVVIVRAYDYDSTLMLKGLTHEWRKERLASAIHNWCHAYVEN